MRQLADGSSTTMPDFGADRDAAIDWARSVLRLRDEEFVLLDTETTGVDPHSAEIVQIGVMSPDGRELMNVLVKPCYPIPDGARNVHGISDAMVRDAPPFDVVYQQLADTLRGKLLIIYNVGYDWTLIQSHCKRYGVDVPVVSDVHCAMLEYARFNGEWNRRYGSYKYKSLPAMAGVHAHDAIADCQSTMELIRSMAHTKKSCEDSVPDLAVSYIAGDTIEEMWEL